MTKILIVDDEFNKPNLVSELALSFGDYIDIQHLTTASQARKSLIENTYDLLLIDINLPQSLGSKPSRLGGIEFYDLLILDPNSKIPHDIIFITEKEDSIEDYAIESAKRGTSLCRFDTLHDEWKIFLSGKIKFILNRSARINNQEPIVDIVILTALNKPELDAVLRLPYNWKMRRFYDDPTSYHFGFKMENERKITFVAANAMRKGLSSSSALAMKMVERFKPKIIVMLGICAGVEGKVNLGDIIVANPTWDWGSGKLTMNETGSDIFLSAPHQLPIDPHLSQIAQDLCRDDSIKKRIIHGWDKNFPSGKLTIHVGPLASGSMVLATDTAIGPIEGQNRELLGIDMEAYAVMSASEYARNRKPSCLVIKAVSDYANSDKNDKWQEYAAYTSVAFFDELIHSEYFPIHSSLYNQL